MIIPAQQTDIISTTFADSTQFQLQADSYLFNLLTSKVYSDPIAATVREISTNAIDACIEASAPINFDVHLPTEQELYFSVRDYGNGISPDLMTTLYCTMGASSKRDSNVYNGAMGLGKLAPLSYAKSFTVTSYIDGSSSSYLVTLSNGIPTLVHMGTQDTSEPNGLLVSVPVSSSDISKFHTAASKIYRYFSHKPNLNIQLSNIELTDVFGCDEWFIDTSIGNSDNFILMANVLYKIPSSYNNGIDSKHFSGLVIRADTGAVSINPGRETLSLDKPTIDYINAKFNDVVSSYIEVIEALYTDPTTSKLHKLLAVSSLCDEAPTSVRQSINIEPLEALTGLSLSTQYSIELKEPPANMNFRIYSRNRKATKSLDRSSTRIKHIFNLPFMIMDIAQDTTNALNTYFTNCIVISRTKGFKIPEFVELVEEWLTDMGITNYVYASDYTDQAKSDKPAISRATGIYGGQFSTTGCGSAELLKPDTPYLYVPISGTQHTLATEDIANIDLAYTSLNSCGIPTPVIVGIPKKYLSLVTSNPNFTPAIEGLQSIFDQHTFIGYDNELRQGLRIRSSNPPKDVYTFYLAYDSFKASFDNRTYIDIDIIHELASLFTIDYIPYTAPIQLQDLYVKYPLLELLSSYGYADTYKEYLDYYFQLEALKHDTSHSTS